MNKVGPNRGEFGQVNRDASVSAKLPGSKFDKSTKYIGSWKSSSNWIHPALKCFLFVLPFLAFHSWAWVEEPASSNVGLALRHVSDGILRIICLARKCRTPLQIRIRHSLLSIDDILNLLWQDHWKNNTGKLKVAQIQCVHIYVRMYLFVHTYIGTYYLRISKDPLSARRRNCKNNNKIDFIHTYVCTMRTYSWATTVEEEFVFNFEYYLLWEKSFIIYHLCLQSHNSAIQEHSRQHGDNNILSQLKYIYFEFSPKKARNTINLLDRILNSLDNVEWRTWQFNIPSSVNR